MLRLKNFSFARGGVPVLQDISFLLQKGAYLSVIGSNGAGKSTLLKCLLRLHESGESHGVIEVSRRPLSDYSQRELAQYIAYVPQAGGRIPPFTVAEFLHLARYPHASRKDALPKDRVVVKNALRLTNMEHLSLRRVDTLSGGERQKAYLAAALAQGTEVMLLDEPTSNLDPKHAAEVNQLLKILNRDHGLTMLTVSHDLNHPLDMGGQVLALRGGQQIFFGEAAQIVEQGILEKTFDHSFTYLQHPRSGKPVVLPDQAGQL